MKKVLISGFKPFLKESINPTEQIVLALNKSSQQAGGLSQDLQIDLKSIVLPVEFIKSVEILSDEVKRFKPDYIIMLGQAGGRKTIQFEKIALNWVQSKNPDESGFVPAVGAIDATSENQPLALMSTFPIDDCLAKLSTKHPVSLSFSAGAYVCNYLYFSIAQEFSSIPSVFIHFPYLPEQVQGLQSSVGQTDGGQNKSLNEPSLSLEKQIHFIQDLLRLI